jgi:hypothetical protein
VLQSEIVQYAERLPGEKAQFGMVTLGLEFGDDDDGEYDLVLGEPGYRTRIR